MNFLSWSFNAGPQSRLEITLDRQANVRLMDDFNYGLYRRGAAYRFVGGLALRTRVRCLLPRSGSGTWSWIWAEVADRCTRLSGKSAKGNRGGSSLSVKVHPVPQCASLTTAAPSARPSSAHSPPPHTTPSGWAASAPASHQLNPAPSGSASSDRSSRRNPKPTSTASGLRSLHQPRRTLPRQPHARLRLLHEPRPQLRCYPAPEHPRWLKSRRRSPPPARTPQP